MTERRTAQTGLGRLRPLIPVAAIWGFGCAVLLVVALQREVPYDELLLDPNNLNGVPWYTGLVSNLGILGWTTATVTGFFGAWIAYYGLRPAAARMLVWGSTLSTLLLADDLFQLHAIAKPVLGLSKSVIFAFYLLVAIAWVLTQWRELRRTRGVLLLAAGGAFALSIGVDQLDLLFASLGPDRRLLVEDAAKFLGVLTWAEYFVLTSGAIVTSIVGELRQARLSPIAQATTTPSQPSPDQVTSVGG